MIAPGAGSTPRYPSPFPAMGPIPPLGRRAVLLRITVVVCVLALSVLVRNTGALNREAEDSRVPPMPDAALVLPGVVRGGAPSDTELAQLHAAFDVRAVVAVGGASVEERAVARDLDVRLLEFDVGAEVPPSPDQLLELVGFVRATTDVPGQAVYVHDATGSGPELVVTAAMLQALGDPTARRSVLDRLDATERVALGAAQLSAVEAVVAVADGVADADNPYAPLREVAR